MNINMKNVLDATTCLGGSFAMYFGMKLMGHTFFMCMVGAAYGFVGGIAAIYLANLITEKLLDRKPQVEAETQVQQSTSKQEDSTNLKPTITNSVELPPQPMQDKLLLTPPAQISVRGL